MPLPGCPRRLAAGGLVLLGTDELLSRLLMTALATALALAPLAFYGGKPGREIEYAVAIRKA